MKETVDSELECRIDRLRSDVRAWARRHDLWHDCDFFDYADQVQPVEWDDTAYVLVLAADGPLSQVVMGSLGGYEYQPEPFEKILRKHGFWYENQDYGSLWIYPFDKTIRKDFRAYMRWKWICSLIRPEFDALHGELYQHFASKPGDIARLHWRRFEELVASVLESQGYDVQLGSGGNDGGVDIRLLQRDPIRDTMTLVQVKRYRERPVRLEAIQALHGVTQADSASKSMFVTTSRYLPSARRFAARKNVPMELYVGQDVMRWCADAWRGIVEDKRLVVSDETVIAAIDGARDDCRRVLHSSGGFGMVTNSFAVVLKETRFSALLLELAREVVRCDGFGQRGEEVPNLRLCPRVVGIGEGKVRRAKKTEQAYWDGSNYYRPWSGKPMPFDYCD